MDPECAIKEIMQKYGTEVLRICMIYLKDYHLAEDIVQNTFLRIFIKYKKTGNEEVLKKPYIIKTAINLCKNQIRTRWFKIIKTTDINIDIKENPISQDEEIIFQKILALKPIYKDVILLYYYQEMSIKEIAKCLNVKESTIKVRLKRARDFLRPELEGEWKNE